jgi:tRNA-2-methylthio-N6-dimethylallyladenosine synthase
MEDICINNNESLRQKEIMNRLNQRIGSGELKYFIMTFGCQMNAHDSEKLKGILEQIGYSETLKEEEADFVIYNTCCVRENAEQKVYGRLGHLKAIKRKNPNLLIAICGCMMQQEVVLNELKKSYRHIDIIFGTHNIYKLAELIETRLDSDETIIDIWDSHKDIVEDLPSIRKHLFKSCINIMYGCNNFCSYCIVPYVRGRERSRKAEDIINEVKNLVSDGVVEIMLLGQNVNSYGKNLDEPITFAKLLRKLQEIDGLKRIRFMTSHPKDLSDELIEAIRECDKICNHLHLPFQSGSTKILDKMNRRYSKDKYLSLIDKIRAVRPDIALTTDIIVGFPGETEEDFLYTMDVVKKVKYDSAFTFIYSKRTGTPAATYENQISEDVIKDRFNRLLEVVNEISYEKSIEHKGKVYNVLVEEINKQNDTLVSGRLSDNHLVHFEGDKSLIGKIVSVKIKEAKSFYLIGELV